MGQHVNPATGVVFSVDDSKDERYAAPKPAPKKAPAKKSSDK